MPSVRQEGLRWLRAKGLDPQDPPPPTFPDPPPSKSPDPPPKKFKYKPYWQECLDDLYSSYGGICAYLAIFFERETGTATTDHFFAKSKTRMASAYEWKNYRLACSLMNTRKGVSDQVLDPFEMEPDTFQLELCSGRIAPNPEIPDELKARAQKTIDKLKLDSPGNRDMRTRRFGEYIEGHCSFAFLRKKSPFIFYEAQRQGLL